MEKYKAKVKYNGYYLFSGDYVEGELIKDNDKFYIHVIEEDCYSNIIREFNVEIDENTISKL